MSSPTNQFTRIQSFIDDFADHDFVICTGYTSCYGLARLSELIPSDCNVKLIVGNIMEHRFKKGSRDDRELAIKFIRRRNVTVYNWYRTKTKIDGEWKFWNPSLLSHGKAIIAMREDDIDDALVGSANISFRGLKAQPEIMVRCHPDDYRILKEYIRLTAVHPPANEKLLQHLSTPLKQLPSTPRSLPQPPPPYDVDLETRSSNRSQKANSGCLPALLTLPIQLLIGAYRRWFRSGR